MYDTRSAGFLREPGRGRVLWQGNASGRQASHRGMLTGCLPRISVRCSPNHTHTHAARTHTRTVFPEVLVESVRSVIEGGLRSGQPLAQHRDRVVPNGRVELLDVGNQRRKRLADVLLIAFEGAEKSTILFCFQDAAGRRAPAGEVFFVFCSPINWCVCRMYLYVERAW